MKLIINKQLLLKFPEIETNISNIIKQDLYFFQKNYPDFQEWFKNKVIPGLYASERTIIIETRHSQIAGLAILKHNSNERKICTLRIKPEFENLGMGIKLFENSFEILKTEAPLLSVSDSNILKFERIFRYFGFIHEKTYNGLYLPRRKELSFNGLLEESSQSNREIEKCWGN